MKENSLDFNFIKNTPPSVDISPPQQTCNSPKEEPQAL
jgi:hypothetical protein